MSKAGDLMRDLMNIVEDAENEIPTVRVKVAAKDEENLFRLDEGKTIPGRFPDNIRLDQSTHTHGVGQLHAHVLDRKGNQIVAVNFDGTGSHSTKGRLHKDDAAALMAQGFKIRADRIVEWWEIPQTDGLKLLLG